MASIGPSSSLPNGSEERPQPFSGCLVRLTWIFFGNAVLVLLVLSFLHEPAWTYTWRDGLFWITVLALVFLRYWDVTRLAGETAHGEPATLHHFRVYAGYLVVLSTVAWLVSHSLQLFP